MPGDLSLLVYTAEQSGYVLHVRTAPDQGFHGLVGQYSRGGSQAVLVRLGRASAGNLGDHKMLGSIGKMRVDFGPGYRLYFTMRERVIVIMLCGGDKSNQSRDIAKARALAAEL